MDKPPEIVFMVFTGANCLTYKLFVGRVLAISVPVTDAQLGVILLCL